MNITRRIFSKICGCFLASPSIFVHCKSQNIDKEKLNDAINENVLFYDADAEQGEYTNRLRALMTDALTNPDFEYWKDKGYGKIVSFIVCDYEILKYYREQGATLAGKDDTLIIGITSTGKYLLGSC